MARRFRGVRRGTAQLLELQSAVGILAILGLAWLASERRRAVPWRLIGIGIVLQFVLALALS